MRTMKSLMLAAVAALSLGTGAAMARDAGAAGYYGATAGNHATSQTNATRYQTNTTRGGDTNDNPSYPGLMGGGG